MSKRTVLILSLLADALDLTGIGHFFPFGLLIDIPITCVHVAYAGKRGLATVLEMVPFGGLLPIFTIAALLYGKPHDPRPLLPSTEKGKAVKP